MKEPISRDVKFDVITQVVGSKLQARIKIDGGIGKEDKFFAYLLKNGDVLDRSEYWVQSPDFSWDLTESGLYSVQAHVKRGSSNTISYSTPDLFLTKIDQEAYATYRDGTPTSPPSDLVNKSFKSKYPYADYVLINCKGDKGTLDAANDFAEQNDLEFSIIKGMPNSSVITTPGALSPCDGGAFIFSGSCFHHGNLIFGKKGLTDIRSIITEEPVGTYTWLSVDTQTRTFSCGSDYFGVEKTYYLQDDELILVSNNYHLLLLMAKQLGASLTIDRNKALATLAFATLQPFHQNFTRSLDVQQVKLLSADEVLHVCEGNLNVVGTSLRDALSEPYPFDYEGYEHLMQKAKDEILCNVKGILEHPSFDHVVVDLSGGMDSRLTFCALTHFPEYSEKIRINSLYSAIEPDDLVVAQEIASLYSYEYDDLPRERVILSGESLAGMHWSYNLGAYYSYTPVPSGNRIPNAARINGAFGEVCARPYYSRKMLGTEKDAASPIDFCDKYFRHHRKISISPSEDALGYIENLFCEELSRIPGRTALERLDNHYIFYRNGLHFSDRYRSQASCPEFGPIQSKSLFRAKMMGYQEFKSAKTQFDIINLLNPVIASLRYESAHDNIEREKVRRTHGILGPKWSEELTICPSDMSASWHAARDRIKYADAPCDAEKRHNFSVAYRSFVGDCFDMALSFLAELRHGGVLESEDILQSIWYLFSRSEEDALSPSIRWNVLNRLASLHIQMKISDDIGNESSYVRGAVAHLGEGDSLSGS